MLAGSGAVFAGGKAAPGWERLFTPPSLSFLLPWGLQLLGPPVCLSPCKGLQSTFGVWHDPDERIDYPKRCLKPSRVQVNHAKPGVVIALSVLELNCPHPNKTASTNKCRVHVAGGCKKQGQELRRGSARLWFLHRADLGKQQERGGSGGAAGS